MERSDGARTTALEFGVEYGVTDAWQLQIGGDGFVRRTADAEPATQGMGDLSLGTKYSWMGFSGTLTHAALGLAIDLPTGSSVKQLGDGVITATPYAVLAHDIPRMWHGQLFAQFALSLKARHSADTNPSSTNASSGVHNQTLWNVGAFMLLGAFRITNELTIQRQIGQGMASPSQDVYFTPGLIWKAHAIEIGAGVPALLNHGVTGSGILLHLIWEFGGDKDP
jgi:hypothetical protein